MTSEPRRTVLSSFSGLGGLDLGLEAAGFEHLGCIEHDAVARGSLKANRDGRWPLVEPSDVTELVKTITPEQLGVDRRQLSVLAGGPPCQPFSKAAQWAPSARTGLKDARSNCLHDFLRLIEIFLPRVVLMENVPGFVRGAVSAVDEINAALLGINSRNGTSYAIDHRIIDAVDFGVPQRRLRAVIVMARDGERFNWPRPTHPYQPTRAWDAIGPLDASFGQPTSVGKWAKLLPSIPEGENYLWHTRLGGGRPLFGYRTRYWSFLLKLAKDQPSWTLPAQPGPATGPFHWDNRPLTTPEMLRLQSFPATWIVEGTYRDQVRQVGNATPPRHAEVIGRAVATQYFGASFSSARLRHHVARAQHIPEAARPSPVPDEFLLLEGEHADHPGTGKGPSPRRSREGDAVASA